MIPGVYYRSSPYHAALAQACKKQADGEREVVVTHYHTDLAWLTALPGKVKRTIYSKASPPWPGSIAIPNNAGRNQHTIFYHICQNYASLAEVTYFLRDKCFDRTFGELEAVWWLRHVDFIEFSTDILDTGPSLCPKLCAVHEQLFGVMPTRGWAFRHSGDIGVSCERVRRRPLDFYQKCLYLLDNGCDGVSKEEVMFCVEQLLCKIFGDTAV